MLSEINSLSETNLRLKEELFDLKSKLKTAGLARDQHTQTLVTKMKMIVALKEKHSAVRNEMKEKL